MFVNEQVINADLDESLNDNSQGYNNFSAPGADRLKITTNLFKKSLTEIFLFSFIVFVNKSSKTLFSNIGPLIVSICDGFFLKKSKISFSCPGYLEAYCKRPFVNSSIVTFIEFFSAILCISIASLTLLIEMLSYLFH